VEVNLAFRSRLNRFRFDILSTNTTVIRFLSIRIMRSKLYIHMIYNNIYLTTTTYARLQKVNDNRIQVASDLLYIIRSGSPSHSDALFTCAIPLYAGRVARHYMIYIYFSAILFWAEIALYRYWNNICFEYYVATTSRLEIIISILATFQTIKRCDATTWRFYSGS
jgi:hypothetical protein